MRCYEEGWLQFGSSGLFDADAPERASNKRNGKTMKQITLIAAFIVASFAGAWTVPAVAGGVTNATTKAACSKAGGVWDASAGKCKKARRGKGY